MKPLAHVPATMPQSGIREIANLAANRPGCIRLDLGEPNFPTPAHIVEAAYRAARDGFTKYTAPVGLLSLREAIADKVRSVNGLDAPPGRIVATSGATSALFNICVALLEHGDEMLMPDPGWPNWEMMILAAGGTVVRYPASAENGFRPEPDEMDRYVGPRAKAIIINTPANPTGAVMPRDLVERMVAFARRHDLWVVSDECYDQAVYDGEHASAAGFDAEGRVFSVFSCSKTYAMTGWRVGYVVVPEGAVEVMGKLQQPVIGSICSVAQKAAEAAFTGPQDCVAEMRDFYRDRRDDALALLERAGMSTWTPAGAFYVMVDVSSAMSDTYSFAKDLLLRRSVSVAPGETFGPAGRGLVRVSLATSPEQLASGIERLIEAVEERAHAA